jgi:hypothetical protein
LLASKEKSEFSALEEIDIPADLSEELAHDVGLDNPYGTEYSIQYLNGKLRDLMLIQDAIKSHSDYSLHIFNIEQNWFEPHLFARQLNREDFKDYKMSVKTLMGGFAGEYFGLNPEYDAELESYKATAKVQKIANRIRKDATVKILGIEEN